MTATATGAATFRRPETWATAEGPPAKYATRRNLALPTIGPRIGVVSQALGAPFMPWQRQVADVLGQAHPTLPGAFQYRLVIVTVPRQAGKTTLLRAVSVDRAVSRPRTGVWMTAQTGKDARKRWRDILEATTARTSPLAPMVKPYLSGGSERLDFPNASFIAPFAPVPKSLHGETPPLVMIDEAWAYDQAQGDALMAAIRPAQITLPHRQLLIVSTKGTAHSAFLNGLIEIGRQAVDDPHSDIAYFEWSADEHLAETDPTGPETLAFHPALGFTQALEDLQAEAEADPNPGNYRRGFLNLETASDTTVLDLARWDQLDHTTDDEGQPLPQHLQPPAPSLEASVIGYSVSDGRAGSSIWQAWEDAGTVRLRFIETAPGARWVAPRLRQLREAGARRFVAEDAGATRTVTTSAAMADLAGAVQLLTTRDYATACATFLGRVTDGTLTHDGAPELREAIEAAALRPMGAGIGFSEGHSAGPIDALKAAVAAQALAETAHGLQIF